ncbi:transposase (plasmid) [Ralstonia solanacearum]|nr:transposase [Ralstonia solanacearum]QKM35665.1 transposase [Ralstonia solanacearum]QKM40655.1 transposase [Ralstonia solanacearum]
MEKEHREREAKLAGKTERYPIDMTDVEWAAVQPLLPRAAVDGAYDRTTLMDKAATLDFVVEVVRRHEQQTGFAVPPRRWVVERTFGWMVRWRRLVRDYEPRADVSEAMIHIAMSGLLLRRIAHP